MIENEFKPEKIILVGVDTGNCDIDVSLDELAELVKTAGGEVVGRISQNLEYTNNKTYVGSGKLDEIKQYIETDAKDSMSYMIKKYEVSDSDLIELQKESIYKQFEEPI